MNNITKRILKARGYETGKEMEDFINPQPHDRKLMKNITEVSNKIKEYIDKRITIFGDYDCDGITSTTIMYKSLKHLGANPNYYIPERVEGYSLSKQAIDKIDADLIITVDCGISSHEEIKYAQEQGIEVVVTDHHEGTEPPCLYVNPKVGGQYPFKDLAGVGVTYKVCQELLDKDLETLIDYVAFATVADVMPLVDENRWIVRQGLKRLNKYPSSPFKMMMDKLNTTKEVSAGYIGFVLAPIINAGGRMNDAKTAIRFMLQEDEDYLLKDNLNVLVGYNRDRKALQEKMQDEIEYDATKNIIIGDYPMQRGLVGLVAGDLKEKYDKPAIVIDSDTGKGSCRSIHPFDITEGLAKASDLLEDYGGHKLAAGFKVKEGKIEEFKQKMYEITENIEYDVIKYDDTINPYSITKSKVRDLEVLQPFGAGNPRPKFLLENVKPYDIKVLKSRHLKFTVDGSIKCIAFGYNNRQLVENEVDLIVKPDINYYAGNEYLQFIIARIIQKEE